QIIGDQRLGATHGAFFVGRGEDDQGPAQGPVQGAYGFDNQREEPLHIATAQPVPASVGFSQRKGVMLPALGIARNGVGMPSQDQAAGTHAQAGDQVGLAWGVGNRLDPTVETEFAEPTGQQLDYREVGLVVFRLGAADGGGLQQGGKLRLERGEGHGGLLTDVGPGIQAMRGTLAEGTAYVRGSAPSAENALQDEEEYDRQDGTGRQGNHPGGKDGAHDLEVQRGDSTCHANPQHRTDQGVGGGNRQTDTRCAHHGCGGRQFGGETTARGQLGDVLADGSDNPVAVSGQADHDADTAQQQNPARDDGRGGNPATRLQYADDCGQRADRVRHIVGAVGKGHGAGGEDHQDAEHAFDAVVLALFHWRVIDTTQQHNAQTGYGQAK